MTKPVVRSADSIAAPEVDRLSDRAHLVAAIEEGLSDERAGLLRGHADVEARARERFHVVAHATGAPARATKRRAP